MGLPNQLINFFPASHENFSSDLSVSAARSPLARLPKAHVDASIASFAFCGPANVILGLTSKDLDVFDQKKSFKCQLGATWPVLDI